ncbi:MAG: hypothetical protein HOM25_07350 [Rhodospirillaceae bacterium]|jgi:hypothetical protein|nr:hypothetical protein [Rhodospirillaceae bacterium]MBT5664512.1 hypothetical protein [Rhodospirillaceae bacterium]MBT5810465.1 hypothetical protein [Rhodospirillaceae bacterium]
MADTNDGSWPKTSSGATDWDTVFEDPDNGLISVIAKAETVDALRQSSLIVIRALFTRNKDSLNRIKYTTLINITISGRKASADLGAMKAAIIRLLRQVKNERVRRAKLYGARINAAAKKKRNARKNRRAPKIHLLVHLFASRPIRSTILAVFLASIIITIVITVGRLERIEPVLFSQTLGSIARSVPLDMPNAAWKVISVTKDGNVTISIEVIVSDARQVSKIKRESIMDRLKIMKFACPAASAQIRKFGSAGGKVWVNLRSKKKLLTGGTCHYQ